MKVILDLGQGISVFTPAGEGRRYHEGELDVSGQVLWCEAPEGRYGIHLQSRFVLFEAGGQLPNHVVRGITKQPRRTNVKLRRTADPEPALPSLPTSPAAKLLQQKAAEVAARRGMRTREEP